MISSNADNIVFGAVGREYLVQCDAHPSDRRHLSKVIAATLTRTREH